MIQFFPTRTVALVLFGFPIHWYGVLYLCAFLCGVIILPRIQKYRNVNWSNDEWMSLASSVVLGVILGGRLGFVLLYEPAFFLSHPTEMLAVWHGGMSFHGGLIGVVVAIWLTLRKRNAEKLRIADLIVIPAALGLVFGRIGNFINLELYGTVTTLPWGITIPGVEGLRHPTQLYSALKDTIICLACLWHLIRFQNVRPGNTFALFLVMYGVLRFCVEFLRAYTNPPISLGALTLSWGQIYSIPVFLAGVVLFVALRRTQDASKSAI